MKPGRAKVKENSLQHSGSSGRKPYICFQGRHSDREHRERTLSYRSLCRMSGLFQVLPATLSVFLWHPEFPQVYNERAEDIVSAESSLVIFSAHVRLRDNCRALGRLLRHKTSHPL